LLKEEGNEIKQFRKIYEKEYKTIQSNSHHSQLSTQASLQELKEQSKLSKKSIGGEQLSALKLTTLNTTLSANNEIISHLQESLRKVTQETLQNVYTALSPLNSHILKVMHSYIPLLEHKETLQNSL